MAPELQISREARLVHEALCQRGLENPYADSRLDPERRIEAIAGHLRVIMEILGLDLSDDSLRDTPQRVARMYVREIFAGLDYRNFPAIRLMDNKMRCDEMVRVQDIQVSSTCEHHLVVIDGRATVAYIPKDKIIGLSKISRIVHFFARRPQLQERLTQQILVALQTLLDTRSVAVTISATHYCVRARGAEDRNACTTTTALGGLFKQNATTRHEFLAR